jgi:hypothetical protein
MKATARHPRIGAGGTLGVAAVLGALLAGALTACGSSSTQAVASSPTPDAVAGSPTSDSLARSYVALVHNYWIQYKASEGNVSLFTRVCWGNPSAVGPGDAGDPSVVDPPRCREIAAAILPAHESFLSNLDSTPAPARFAADDQVLRSQLPKAIADVKAMMAAAGAGNREGVIQYMTAYVNDMVPGVLVALDVIDPSVVHD